MLIFINKINAKLLNKWIKINKKLSLKELLVNNKLKFKYQDFDREYCYLIKPRSSAYIFD
jgi:hypothetical protein